MNAIAATIITDEEQQSFNDLAGTFAENQLGEFIHDHEYPYRLDPANAIRGIGELGFLAGTSRRIRQLTPGTWRKY